MTENNGRTQAQKGGAVRRPRPLTRSDELKFPAPAPGKGWGWLLPWLQVVSTGLSLASTFVMLAVALPMLGQEQNRIKELGDGLDRAAEHVVLRDKWLQDSRDLTVRTQAALIAQQEAAKKVTEENLRLANELSGRLQKPGKD